MFAVIISEKGGAERRQTYDQTEVNVGRVQGNDLMLPKGNVSKRHAKVVYKDGRFIVTDNKSTNGTYVNGRKIAQATIVRESDKIYIGDFILRIEPVVAGAEASADAAPSDASDASDASASESGSGEPRESPAEAVELADAESSVSAPDSEPARPIEPPRVDAVAGAVAPRAPGLVMPPSSEIVSHFPLEHDPDEAPAALPAPPRVPGGAMPALPLAGSRTASLGTAPKPPPLVARAPEPPAPLPQPPAFVAPPAPPAQPAPVGAANGSTLSSPGGASPSASSAQAPRRTSDRDRPRREAPASAPLRAAVAAIVERAEGLAPAPLVDAVALSLDATRALEAAIESAVTALRAEGAIAAEVDAVVAADHARRELVETGPLGALLAEDDVHEVQVPRFDHVVAFGARRGQTTELGFSTPASFARALRRLCDSSGQPLASGERFVERHLPGGVRLSAMLAQGLADGAVLTLRKPQVADQSVDDLVRSGAVSRAMAVLFGLAAGARANVLVTGTPATGAALVGGALASTGGDADRVVVLHDDDELALPNTMALAIALPLDDDGVRAAVRSAARVRPDRMLISGFSGRVAAEVLEAIGAGQGGVVAISRAPSIRHALARLPADLAAARPGFGADAARELVAAAFDLVVEVTRLRDGRFRVTRVADLVLENDKLVARDVFVFSIERTAAGGAVEGVFHPSGHVPPLVDDAVARGVSVDTSLFRRAR